MIALVQRVVEASVTVRGQVTGAIGPGLLILLGVHRDDSEKEVAWVASKCARLRVFADAKGRMNRSLLDTGGDALVVSQFTLYGNVMKGHRPAFSQAAAPIRAELLYRQFIRDLSAHLARSVSHGIFGAMMQVQLINDGPVTIWIQREPSAA